MRKINAGEYIIDSCPVVSDRKHNFRQFEEMHFIKIDRNTWDVYFGHGMTDFSAPTLRECRAHYGI